MCCWRRFVRFLCIQSRDLFIASLPLHGSVRKATKVEKSSDRGKTIVLRILNSPLSSSPPSPFSFYLAWYRFRRARLPHNRDKLRGWKAERGRRREKVKEREKRNRRRRREQLVLHTISTRPAVSLRENKVSLRSVRTLRDAGGRGENVVLINISSGFEARLN